ncbi:MAG TPA: hypothetical protein VKR59_04155 [Terriglobales bacterium]|nr:hypothetical protein [Terriglobales bacterium]
MRRKIETAVLVLALIVGIMPRLMAQVSLQDQLNAQYKLVKMGTDSSGAAVVEEGTILVVKKGGILGTAYTDTNIFATHYENGAVHSPNPLGQKALGFGLGKLGKQAPTTQFFQANVKVYPSKVVVNLPKDQVVIGIVDCDSCNNVDPKTFFKADVVFQFPHGTLATANPSNVEDTIAGLLATDDSGGGDQGNNQGGNGNGSGNDQGGNQNGGGGNGGGGGGQAQQGPPPEPQQIEKGQTTDQVKAAIGVPDKIVNLGAKQIYVYKDIKVTFLNGKVSDVQ